MATAKQILLDAEERWKSTYGRGKAMVCDGELTPELRREVDELSRALDAVLVVSHDWKWRVESGSDALTVVRDRNCPRDRALVVPNPWVVV